SRLRAWTALFCASICVAAACLSFLRARDNWVVRPAATSRAAVTSKRRPRKGVLMLIGLIGVNPDRQKSCSVRWPPRGRVVTGLCPSGRGGAPSPHLDCQTTLKSGLLGP